MADESIELRVGQEHPVRLAPGAGASEWNFSVEGMSSAVDVQKMWTSRPYEEDDEDKAGPPPPRAMVFVIRAVAPGDATVRFRSGRGETHDVSVHVEP
jgi:hypothetical protein